MYLIGINLLATSDSMDSIFLIYSKQSFLTNNANVLRNSDDDVPNEPEVKFFLQLSASRPDGIDPPILTLLPS